MAPKEPSIGIMKRLLRYFVAGVFAVLPLVMTIVAITWAISFLADVVGPETYVGEQLSKFGLRMVANRTAAYVVGWLGVAALIFTVGFFVESGMRGLLKKVAEALLRRIPLIGKVYDTSQQLVDMIDTGGDDKLEGMSVVYCTFGQPGGTGVLALLPTKQTIAINGQDYHVVLVPQSPVPIGGGLLFMPAHSVEHVNISVDTLMSIYVSMGVVAPGKMRGVVG